MEAAGTDESQRFVPGGGSISPRLLPPPVLRGYAREFLLHRPAGRPSAAAAADRCQADTMNRTAIIFLVIGAIVAVAYLFGTS